MIDLRSDTLTKPTEEMLQAIVRAEVGDDGRTNAVGKGEDPTVNKLESLAARKTNNEDALFCNSGTMANIVGLLTHCNRGDTVAIDRFSHIYKSEKSLFSEQYFGLTAHFYETNNLGVPLLTSIENIVNDHNVKLIALENSVSYEGGTTISPNEMDEICDLAATLQIPVHVDGARIFNVAAHHGVTVAQFTTRADSVQICLSKGLGAPVGSVLCGSKQFIKSARNIRKIIGGEMRQAGIIAAAGIVSLTQGVEQSTRDNERARILAEGIASNKAITIDLSTVQTNIINFDVAPSGYSAQQFTKSLAEKGLLVRPITNTKIRMIVYREIDKEAISKSIDIINNVCGKKN